MKINCKLGHVYQGCDERLDTLDIYLEEGERIAVGDVLDIPMMDGSTIQREIKALNPQSAGDFAPISDAIAQGVAEGRHHVTKSPVTSVKGPAAHCQQIRDEIPRAPTPGVCRLRHVGRWGRIRKDAHPLCAILVRDGRIQLRRRSAREFPSPRRWGIDIDQF